MNLNKAMIIGNLTRDPEARTTPQGANVTSFSVATNFVWTDANGQKQEKVEFHNIVAWRKLGEICAQYLKKGSKVYIEGRLQTRDWEGQDGVKRYRTEIIAENMIMLDRAGQQGVGYQAPTASTPVSAPSNTATTNDAPAKSDDDEIKIENIPF
jgi:single-strand DNA-binding protein